MDDMGSLIPRRDKDGDGRLGGDGRRLVATEADSQRHDDRDPDEAAKGYEEKEKGHKGLPESSQRIKLMKRITKQTRYCRIRRRRPAGDGSVNKTF